MSRLLLEGMIEIHAPANRVWTILTDSTFIQQYMFGCVVETSWKQGSPLLWKGAADGHLYVKGDVVAIDALHRLEYTVLGVDLKIADVPQNYLTITYELKKNNKNSTQLYVSMGDFNAVSGGKARYDETIASGGWTPRLGKIKQLAENP
jgi:uncharacterized protein YndB with AHSA1/START domain